ncbi:MAG: class I SAM-dependent methyltransferase [Pseudomonadota bacterium]
MKKQKHSALLRHIESLQGERPWGAMLDAGTGVNSLRWVSGLASERWTAVTGSAGEAERARGAIGAALRPQDRIVLGNWADPDLLKGEAYDTVLADYVLGAVEGFAPYFQSYLFARLRPLTRGVLYVTGLEPYVHADRPEAGAERVVWEIGRFRDACILLAGDRPYREYPAPWVADHLQRAGFAVRDVKHFAIGYKEKFVTAQIEIALRGLEMLADQELAKPLEARGEALRAEALEMIAAEGALRGCRNYVIAAEPV